MIMIEKSQTARLSFIARITVFLFFIVFLSFSPNYIFVIYPQVKDLILVCFILFVLLHFMQAKKIVKYNASLYLFLFYGMLFITSLLNYLRLDNFEGVIFSLSLCLKFLIIFLFLMSFDELKIITILKVLSMVMVLLCIWSLFGEVLYILGIVSVTRSIEFQSYFYHVISFWGVYTVSFNLYDTDMIRNQLFFQEPGFFAFYIFVSMVIISLIRECYEKKIFFILYVIYFITILSTMSATGIVLSGILTIYIFRNIFISIIFLCCSMVFLTYILISDNPYVNKIGSLGERLYGLTSGLHIFSTDTLNFLIGAGYESELMFSFDGKFNNFILEIMLYSGVFNLILFLLFFLFIMKSCVGARFKYFLILIFCATTPLFWSPIMIILNVILLRYKGLRLAMSAEMIK